MKKSKTKSQLMNDFASQYKVGDKVKGITIKAYARDEEGNIFVVVRLDEFATYFNGA